MNYVRLSFGWNRHPKIVKLKKKLGAAGVLGLLKLWTFAAEYRPDGVLVGMDYDDIANAADYSGESGTFVAVLIQSRLLDRIEGKLYIHDLRVGGQS
ncbi:MAG: hypothetical protein IPK48_07830 [Gammaproteobacteria bacterium]|nr:hypothetical protein [Gammaproteobacteria bacterium]